MGGLSDQPRGHDLGYGPNFGAVRWSASVEFPAHWLAALNVGKETARGGR